MSATPALHREIATRREIILATAPASARRRILGKRPRYQPLKAHYIEVNCKTLERTVDSRIIAHLSTAPMRNPFRPQPAKNEVPRDVWRILDVVARAWQVTVDDLRGRRHQWKFTHPRFAAMLLIRERMPAWSTTRIGKAFGGRDHTTAMAAIKRAKELIAGSERYRETYHAALASLDERSAESAR